ncbi:isoaspartyl peptidase/L-asparaginase [bacterium]|nr:isoaspartyl peptidase/L-asparaginase [bacterium]
MREGREPCVIVHGGAGKLPDERARKKVPVMREAVMAAWEEVQKGKPAEFGVAAALREMERSPYFNAGYGGYPNVHGIVLLDLGLMRGNRDFVSLLNCRKVKYPSAIALDMLRENRAIMTVWTHELMSEVEDAAPFIQERYGLVGDHAELLSPVVLEWLRDGGAEFSSTGETTPGHEKSGGTVGCVVRDLSGELCAGTSTGGVNSKDNGRIGDTPVIGSGVFADNEIGGLSTTGHGESLLLGLVSGFVLGELRRALRDDPEIFHRSPEKLRHLVREEFRELSRKTGSRGGGMIVIPPQGPPAFSFNSEMISVAQTVGGGEVPLIESFIAKKDGSRLTD